MGHDDTMLAIDPDLCNRANSIPRKLKSSQKSSWSLRPASSRESFSVPGPDEHSVEKVLNWKLKAWPDLASKEDTGCVTKIEGKYPCYCTRKLIAARIPYEDTVCGNRISVALNVEFRN
jgi:hypothetical protein